MSVDQTVRSVLTARAGAVDSAPLSGPELRAAAREARRRARRAGLVAAAVAAGVIAVLLVVPSAVRGASLPPASSQVDTWPARGDLAGDAGLAAAARRAWEAAPVLRGELPHRDVRILLAANTSYGRYVILTGRNALGHRRVAVFSDDPRDHAPYAKRMRLRSDSAFPDGKLVTYATQRRVGQVEQTLLLVVGPPDVTEMRWRDEFESWQSLPSGDGVAAWVVHSSYPEQRVRAYRGTHRVAEARAVPGLRTFIYRPDEALIVADEPDRSECHNGVCVVRPGSDSGVVSARPNDPGTLGAVQRPERSQWQDMTDQAEQLWLNYASPTRNVSAWGSGSISLSAILADGTGVYLSEHNVNGGPNHLVLYVDRPEWAIGQLYLAKPLTDDTAVRVVSALVPADHGGHLVVFAADGVSIRYRIGRGAWRPVTVTGGVGAAALGFGFGADAVSLEITVDGHSDVAPLDTYMELPNP